MKKKIPHIHQPHHHKDKAYLKRVGLSLYVYRKMKNVSLDVLYEDIDLKQSTLCSYESGRRQIDLFALSRLSEHYGYSTDRILKKNPLDELWEKYNNAKTTKEKERLGNIIMEVYSFMKANNGDKPKNDKDEDKRYPEWWMNEILSMVGDVARQKAKEFKKKDEM